MLENQEMVADVLHYIMPFIVGGVIGYLTNKLAIKMLFRPRTPHFLFRW